MIIGGVVGGAIITGLILITIDKKTKNGFFN
jgi:hypothetical protein